VNKRLLNVAEKVFLEWFILFLCGQIKGYITSIGREMDFPVQMVLCFLFF
jgi:hypothetical protein